MGSVTVIGAGAVARSFTAAFRRAGIGIDGLFSAQGNSARTLARKSHIRHSGAMNGTVPLGDIILICVPDDAIPAAVKRLAESGPSMKGRIVLHTSGGAGSDRLFPLKKFGASVGSIHPLQTFPRTGPVTSLRGVHCAVEGDRTAVAAAETIARRTGMRPFRITAGKKSLYHAAAVFASNFPVALLGVMEEVAARSGIAHKKVLSVFAPLVERSISNAMRLGPAEALTGPAARGDIGTMQRHRTALRAVPDGKRLTELYDLLSREAGRLAQRKRR